MGNLQHPCPQSWMMIMLVSLAILFSSCFSQSSGGELLFERSQQQQHTASLIQEACSHSRFPDICISSLESDPRSFNANLKGLTAISIDITKANGTAILAYITNELIGNSTTNVSHDSVKDCQKEYQDSVRYLEQARTSFNDGYPGEYRSINMLLGTALANTDACMSDGSIVVQEVPPLLIQMSEIMFKLCSNSLAIFCQFAPKGCAPRFHG